VASLFRSPLALAADDKITTVAGKTNLMLNNPKGVVLDKDGNLYIADTENHRIRKVTPGGTISTIAGTGTAGYAGDDGAATSAQLNNPKGMAVDSSGNLYIADTDNQRIRKVTPAGMISTVAGTGTAGNYPGDGGPATSAELNSPFGVAVDSDSNLYIADTGNSRIFKVDATSKNISIVAGTGTLGFTGDNGAATSAKLALPSGVTVDSNGNLYIADTSNYRIRKVTPGGTISTIAGTGVQGPAGDDGAATSAELNSPFGVAVDSRGNLYIADTENHRIRKVTPGGTISTVAGTGTGGYAGDDGAAISAELNSPFGMAVDSSNNLYIADTYNHRIRKVATNGIITTVEGAINDNGPATSAQLNYPTRVAVDSSGNLYIADAQNNRIRKVTPGGTISTVAGTGTPGYAGDDGAATSAELNNPNGMAFDSSGNLYIADSYNHRIRKVTPGGTISTVAGTGTPGFTGDNGAATSAQLALPVGVAVDSSGNLYIADSQTHRIRKVDAKSNIISTVAGGGTPTTGVGDEGAATSAELNRPVSVAVDSSGNLYIADAENNRIRKVATDTNHTITTVAGTGTPGYAGDDGAATSAELFIPYDVAVDSLGNLYIADTENHRIRKVARLPRPPSVPSPVQLAQPTRPMLRVLISP